MGAITLIAAVVLYGLCFYMSYKAADIFNQVVAERQLFPGTVTVERLTATPGGTVSFEGLVWNDEDGDTLVQIPEGQFTVKLSDVLTGHIGTQTVEDVTLNNAYIHLIFNDKMELQHIKKASDHHSSGPKDLVKVTGPKSNRPFNCHVALHQSVIEAEAPGRYFKIGDVEFSSAIHTKGKTKIDLRAGHFSGMIDAKSLRIRGPLYAPVIDGTLKMDRLDITALVFTDVVGQVHYEQGLLDINEVTAGVFGGSMKGHGQVNLDDKSYTADMTGSQLKGGIAAHDLFLRCNVDLNLHMEENKTTGTKAIYGDFQSGPGRYHQLPFRGISGSFAQDGKTLNFRDVVISMFFGDVSTDAFSIVNGKVKIGAIDINYKNGKRSRWGKGGPQPVP